MTSLGKPVTNRTEIVSEQKSTDNINVPKGKSHNNAFNNLSLLAAENLDFAPSVGSTNINFLALLSFLYSFSLVTPSPPSNPHPTPRKREERWPICSHRIVSEMIIRPDRRLPCRQSDRPSYCSFFIAKLTYNRWIFLEPSSVLQSHSLCPAVEIMSSSKVTKLGRYPQTKRECSFLLVLYVACVRFSKPRCRFARCFSVRAS